jgi:thymidine phosphorylase
LLRGRSGDQVHRGEPLFEIHAETPGELAYAQDYATAQPTLFRIEEPT